MNSNSNRPTPRNSNSNSKRVTIGLAAAGVLVLAMACAAQSDAPPPKDPFEALLDGLPAITEAAREAEMYDVEQEGKPIGWGRLDLEARPGEKAGYGLHVHFLFAEAHETVSASLTADVDARFRPTRVQIEQKVRTGEEIAWARDAMETTAEGLSLIHTEDQGEPMHRTASPTGPYIVGIEFLLPTLPRKSLDGATILELDPQAGEVQKRTVKVLPLPQGRAAYEVKDADGERKRQYGIDANGRLEWIEQAPFTFHHVEAGRWEELRKLFPDIDK